MIFKSFKFSWYLVGSVYIYTTWKKSNSLVVFKRQRLDFQMYFNDCRICIIHRWRLILHFFVELLMMYPCSAVWHLAKHCFLIWTLQGNLQGKWLYNTIASTLLVNCIIRYPFITYPLSELSQVTWCLGFTSMKFSVAIIALACLLGLQCHSGRWFLWSPLSSSWVDSMWLGGIFLLIDFSD